MVGDNVEIKIISIDGDQVKLGIVAPKSVKVHRSEVFEAIRKQNEEALLASQNVLKALKIKK